MRVLIVGASGFIGRHLSARLSAAGHDVVGGVRHPRGDGQVRIDLASVPVRSEWAAALRGVDVVINAAGIFGDARRYDAVHDAGPRALFAACEAAGVRRVIQVSALGADAEARTPFHLSKRAADDALRASRLDWVVVQPSLVFGPGGASARQFALLATLPLVPVPGDGRQRVQPMHIDDLAELVLRLAEASGALRTTIAAVGPRAVTLREWLAALRVQLGRGRARFVPVPLALARLAAGEEAMSMLARGNTAPPAEVARFLGRTPRDVDRFLTGPQAGFVALRARLDGLLPVLRASVAFTWIVTGVLSLGIYPVGESLAMLARVGLTGVAAYGALYGAALLDLAFGVGIYAVRRRVWLWRLQLALIAGYSVVIALRLPEYWLHPFGPLLKNIPLMAAIWLLHEFEPEEARPWST